MGKSSKKIKNDRINTIRKQYDAFLEEDKKRRDRNEYILSKLEKMRSSTALVSISNKPSVTRQMEVNFPELYVRSDDLRAKSVIIDSCIDHSGCNITSGLLNRHADEATILKELSKKYIFIPKRTTPFENLYTYPKNVIDDKDWKSKYNILDDLKKQEKEPVSDTVVPQNKVTFFSSEKDSESTNCNKPPDNLDNNSSPSDEQTHNKHDNLTDTNELHTFSTDQRNEVNDNANVEIPEINKQVGEENNISLETTPILSNTTLKIEATGPVYDKHETDNVQEIIQTQKVNDKEEKENYKGSNSNNINQITPNASNDSYINNEGTIRDQIEYQENIDQSNYDQLIPESNEYIAIESVRNASLNNYEQIVIDEKPEETKAVEFLKDNVNINETIENNNDVSIIQDIKSTDQVELYGSKGNEAEGQVKLDQIPHDSVHYQPTPENNEVVLENTVYTEPVNHETEINAFEAEQQEMFYSEQAGGETYGYNQEDTNIGEYPTEGYEHSDQYAYYDGAQQEQAYATNINEHEESTERYDPHYNEQYETSYENQNLNNTVEYDNPNVYDQQQFQDGTYGHTQSENVVNHDNQDDAKLYQQRNISNEYDNEIQENLLPKDSQIYNQHLYIEQSDAQENIEQQLTMEEGYIENIPVNADDIQKDDKYEADKELITTNVEQTHDPKFS